MNGTIGAWNAGWARRGIVAAFGLAAVSPAFAWAADRVAYAEPLDNAADATGATAHEVTHNPGLLPEYTVPGADPLLGTFVSAVVGVALTLAVATAIARLLAE